MTDLLPILHEIEIRVELDLALALRKAGRERRQARARKGWATRRWRATCSRPTGQAASRLDATRFDQAQREHGINA